MKFINARFWNFAISKLKKLKKSWDWVNTNPLEAQTGKILSKVFKVRFTNQKIKPQSYQEDGFPGQTVLSLRKITKRIAERKHQGATRHEGCVGETREYEAEGGDRGY